MNTHSLEMQQLLVERFSELKKERPVDMKSKGKILISHLEYHMSRNSNTCSIFRNGLIHQLEKENPNLEILKFIWEKFDEHEQIAVKLHTILVENVEFTEDDEDEEDK